MPFKTPQKKLIGIGWIWLFSQTVWAQESVPRPDAGQLQLELQQEQTTLESTQAAIQETHPSSPPLSQNDEKQTRIAIKGFKFQGNTLLSDLQLQPLVAHAIDQMHTLPQLEELANRITQIYRQKGYLAAYVYLPEQTITDGVLLFNILEGHLEEVQIKNTTSINTHWLEQIAKNQLCKQYACHNEAATQIAVQQPHNTILQRATLERALYLLADIPGVKTQAKLVSGKTLGSTNIVIDIEPNTRSITQFSLDNYGNRYTGIHRAQAYTEINNPLAIGDRFIFHGLSTGRYLNNVGVGYAIPVNTHGMRLGTQASYVYYALGSEFTSLQVHGDTYQLGLHLSQPIHRSAQHQTEWRIGWEYNRFRDFFDENKTSSKKYKNSWIINLKGQHHDLWGNGGYTQWQTQLSWGQLKLGDISTRRTDQNSARTAGSYIKFSTYLTRLQALPFTFSWARNTSLYTHLSAQWPNKNLHSSEKILFGGPTSVRAYPIAEISADCGTLATIELRHTLPTFQGFSLQPLMFYDTATAIRINHSPWKKSTDNHRTLSGGGIGLQITYKQQTQIKLSWAIRTSSSTRSETNSRTRLWAQAQIFF